MKKLFVPVVLLALLILLFVVRFFTFPVITVVCAPYERQFLEKLVHAGLSGGYRVAFSQSIPDGPYLATPSVNVEMGSGYVFSSAELVLEPDDEDMWRCAYGLSGGTFSLAILFDSSSLHEIGLQSAAPGTIGKYSYDGRISSVQAGAFERQLAEDRVQTLIVYSPKGALELLRRDQGLSIVTTDLYAEALETVDVLYTVGPDYSAMLKMVKEKRSGRVKVPYVLLPVKQGLEVLPDRFLELFD